MEHPPQACLQEDSLLQQARYRNCLYYLELQNHQFLRNSPVEARQGFPPQHFPWEVLHPHFLLALSFLPGQDFLPAERCLHFRQAHHRKALVLRSPDFLFPLELQFAHQCFPVEVPRQQVRPPRRSPFFPALKFLRLVLRPSLPKHFLQAAGLPLLHFHLIREQCRHAPRLRQEIPRLQQEAHHLQRPPFRFGLELPQDCPPARLLDLIQQAFLRQISRVRFHC